MWDLLGYALLAAGSLFSTYKTNKTNKEIYQQQNEFNESMQDKQNDYNLPKNQVDRLLDAGINPIAGTMANGMSVSGNTSAGINQSTAFPFVDPFTQLSNNALSLMNSYKLNAEGKTSNSLRQYEIERIKAQTSDYLANVVKLGVDTKGQMIANDYAVALNELALERGKSEIDLNYQQIAYLNSQKQKIEYELTTVLPQEVQESISRTHLNVLEQDRVVAEIERCFAETDLAAVKSELVGAQVSTELDRQQNIQSDTELRQSEKKSLDQQIQLFLDTYDAQMSIAASKAKISKKEANSYYLRQILSRGQAGSAALSGAAGAIGSAAIRSGAAASGAGYTMMIP